MSNLILFGFKGVGKTYFGKRLAKECSRPFIDTDILIEHAYGVSCRELFQKVGEKRFRKLEHGVIASLAGTESAIISLGGGAIFAIKNRFLLEKIGCLIYLDISKETLKKRILAEEIPAFLDKEDPENSFETYYRERKPLYDKITSKKILLDGKSDTQIVEELKKIGYGQQ